VDQLYLQTHYGFALWIEKGVFVCLFAD
jgi:hypothetical protein